MWCSLPRWQVTGNYRQHQSRDRHPYASHQIQNESKKPYADSPFYHSPAACGVALLTIAVGLLVTDGEPARAQEGGEERREGYEKRLAARIARYQEARAARAAEEGRVAAGLISGLASTIRTGESDEFTVSSDGLDPDTDYRYSFDIGAKANPGSSDDGIGFNSSCSLNYTGFSNLGGSTSLSGMVELYACIRGDYTITAELYEYSAEEDETYELETDDQTVTVVNGPPTFNPISYDFEVPEDADIGEPLGTVLATDPDNDPLTYSITRGNTGNAFAIVATGSSAGQITVARNLSGVNTSFYSLTVRVRDGDDGQDTASVSITVEDVNEAPAITGGSSFSSFPENSTYVVSTYTASDPDGDNVAWTLSGNDRARFSIGAASGQLSFLAPPDFEGPTDVGLNNTYSFTVVATDDGSPRMSASRDVTIRVTDVNEVPAVAIAVADQMLTVNGSSATIDLSDKFSDPDSGDTLRYSASSSAPSVATVSVNGSDLEIAPAGVGTTTVTVTAHDFAAGVPLGLTVFQTFVSWWWRPRLPVGWTHQT